MTFDSGPFCKAMAASLVDPVAAGHVCDRLCARGERSRDTVPKAPGPPMADAHEHWTDLQSTFSAQTYEKMLANHALTAAQRQQLMKMRDRRSRVEAEMSRAATPGRARRWRARSSTGSY